MSQNIQKCLPDCMMPDGGEACAGYQASLEKLDDFESLYMCDCCEALHADCVDAGGHMQCPACCKLANQDAEIGRLEVLLQKIRLAAQEAVSTESMVGGEWLLETTETLSTKGDRAEPCWLPDTQPCEAIGRDYCADSWRATSGQAVCGACGRPIRPASEKNSG